MICWLLSLRLAVLDVILFPDEPLLYKLIRYLFLDQSPGLFECKPFPSRILHWELHSFFCSVSTALCFFSPDSLCHLHHRTIPADRSTWSSGCCYIPWPNPFCPLIVASFTLLSSSRNGVYYIFLLVKLKSSWPLGDYDRAYQLRLKEPLQYSPCCSTW